MNSRLPSGPIACLSSLGELALSTNFGQPKEAHQKTLNWLWDIDSELFAWIKTGSGIFAVTGKPGSGKSVLMNEVATRVRKRHRHQFGVIVQYAFNARGAPREHSFDGFLRFAISQVLRQRPSSFEAVVDEWVHLAHDSGLYGVGNGLRDLDEVGSILWPIPSLKTALVSATAHAARESPVCFIIDALDECDGGAESIHDLVTFISDMVSALPPNSEDSIKICFSCRDLPSNFGGAIAGGFRMEHRNEPDIAAYVNDRWSTLESIVEPGNNLKQIKTDLVKKADGIFLWAYLALERIQTALRDGATVAELQETVNDIPEELGGLFALLLGNINPKYTAETNTMLAVALSAGRPLSLTEFRYATALSTSLGTMSHSGLEKSPTFVPDDGTMRKRIRSRCGGLLEVKAWNETTGDEDGLGPHYTEVVQFIHQSVKDSLLANLSKQPSGTQQSHSLISEGHDKLARCCLQYLSTKEVQELASHIRADSRVDKRWLQRRKKELPFLNYAVESCFHHCQQAEKSGISHAELIDQLFAPEDERFSDYVALRNAVHKGEKYSPGLSVLQLAVEHDLANYVELRLILDPADVNAVLDCGDNYVQIAVRKEHVKTLKVLVAHGADVNSSHSSYSPSEVELYKSLYNQVRPLVVACQKGNIEMVQLLLEHGADVSACDSYRGHTHINQALVSAAYSGSIEVVRRLLDSDHSSLSHPDIRVSAIAGLSYALHKRLYNETKSDARSYRKQEHEAELEKMRQISDLILSDIDVHQIGFEMGSAALFWYHTGCQKEVLQRLIDIGTDFVGIDMNSMPFLYAACLRGTASSVQMLLQNNVDPHITLGPSDSSYLHAALLGKTPAVLSYLLQHGLEVDLQDKNGETPLHAAAAYGTDDFIDVLLYHNADIGMRDLSGRRPFWHAVGNRGLKHTVNILERLLYQDSDIQLVDRDGITPLHNAAECGSLAAVEWLLSRGADPTALDDWGLTALHWAAASASVDSTDCLALLLNHKPPTSTKPRLDINARDSSDLTSLHYVLRFWTFHRSDPISNSDPSVAIANAKLLLQRGADLDAIDNAGNTPLHLAALRGIKELVRLFLREGADPNACDVNGLRPLDLAHLEDVRELLEDAMAANDAAYGAA